MRRTSRAILAAGLALAGGVTAGNAAAEPAQFRLSSPAFADGEEIPARFTCDGANASPPLAWTDPPPGTKSLALVVTDLDAPEPSKPIRPWTHWVVYAMTPDVRALDEGASRKLPAGARSGRSDWKTADYGGPCPSVGNHRYVFKLYALDLPPSNFGSPSKAALLKRVGPNVLGEAVLTGLYERGAAEKKP